MAVTQTDHGPSLKLIAQTLLQSGRRVGITQLTKTLKEWMGEFGGFGTRDVAYLVLPNKARVICASKVFGWFLRDACPDDFTVSQPVTPESARRILAATLTEEEVTRIWP